MGFERLRDVSRVQVYSNGAIFLIVNSVFKGEVTVKGSRDVYRA